MENKRKSTTHFAIFNYWKDKAIRKDGTIVLINEMSKNDIPVVEDWGEPCCWCCGKFIHQVYNLKSYDENIKTFDNLNKIWNCADVRRHLNRCHIIPFAKNGDESPENLFLMCEACHVMAPDTIIPKYFFNYVYNKRFNIMYDGVGRKEFFDLDRRLVELSKQYNKDYFSLVMDYNKFMKLMYEKANELAVCHNGKLGAETIAAILCECMDFKKEDE